MNVIAASTLAFLNKPFSEALEEIGGIGFDGVEIYYEGKHSLPEKEIVDALSSYDLRVFLHAPFSDLNLASFNETVLEESKRQIKASLDVAAEIGAELATVHFGRYSPLGLSYPEAAFERNLESVKEISGYADALDIDVAFENAPKNFGALAGSLEVLEKLINDAGVNITLDIGHANTWNHSLQDFILGLNSSIAHIHMHDNTGEADMHMALGDGAIDVKAAFKALKEINYKRALCLEMLYEEDLGKSRERIKSMMGGSG